ncbi:MAG: hypothetical protein KC550_07725 [Nanoarchaeota archaeon]|nr:hypothetical protein [Nanoarchaeota archaeon]
MNKNKRKQKKIDFLLENNHYKRLQIYLYVLSLIVILSIYFLIIISFPNQNTIILTAIISVTIGFYFIFNRDRLVKKLSDKLQDTKRKKIKKENKDGLKHTLSKLKSKEKKRIKLNIGGKEAMKDKIKNFKSKFKSEKNSKQKEYIEIK